MFVLSTKSFVLVFYWQHVIKKVSNSPETQRNFVRFSLISGPVLHKQSWTKCFQTWWRFQEISKILGYWHDGGIFCDGLLCNLQIYWELKTISWDNKLSYLDSHLHQLFVSTALIIQVQFKVLKVSEINAEILLDCLEVILQNNSQNT